MSETDNTHNRFSVVIPVHNKAPHVKRSISSVLDQTHTGFELLIIDDASTDNSIEEIEKFADERIRFFRRESPGPGGYAARNLGVREAASNWIAFLDADDCWNPDHLEKMKTLHHTIPDATLLGAGWFIVEDGNCSLDPYSLRNRNQESHVISIQKYLNGPRPFCTSVVCVRTDVMKSCGMFDERWNHGADTELWLRLLLNGAIGAWSNHIGATYHRDSVNMVTKSRRQTASPNSSYIHAYLKKNPGHIHKKALMRYGNRAAYKPALRHIATHGMSFRYLKEHFFLSVTPQLLTRLAIVATKQRLGKKSFRKRIF